MILDTEKGEPDKLPHHKRWIIESIKIEQMALDYPRLQYEGFQPPPKWTPKLQTYTNKTSLCAIFYNKVLALSGKYGPQPIIAKKMNTLKYTRQKLYTIED